MVVVHNAAVRADGNINSRFFKIFVSCLANVNKCGRLTPAYALCFSCNAYRAAAYAYLYKVSSRLG